MWISKKKYNELVAQKNEFERIASDAVAQNGRLLDAWHETLEKMKDIQEFNHILVDRNEELSARCKELEQEYQRVVNDRNLWAREFEELDVAYGELAIQVDRLTEERDFYEDKATYLEGEVEDLEERIADKDIQNAELAGMVRSLEKKRDCLKAELSVAIKQRDYYYDLLESTSDAYEEGKVISREAE